MIVFLLSDTCLNRDPTTKNPKSDTAHVGQKHDRGHAAIFFGEGFRS